jgi:hypothetical protein
VDVRGTVGSSVHEAIGDLRTGTDSKVGTSMSGDAQSQEYSEVCQNWRHYSSLRFGILTVFLALLAGIFGILTGESVPAPTIQLGLKLAGLVITVIFGVYQEMAMRHLAHFGNRAAELERELGYRSFSGRPRASLLLTMDFVTRLFYLLTAAFWLLFLVTP